MFRRATTTATIGLATGVVAFTFGAGPAFAASTFVAQWNMKETSGTTMVDSSGNNNNGTTYNVTRTGDGYVFNGTTSKVVVQDKPSLNPGASNFSYSVRVNRSPLPVSGTDYDLIRKGLSGTSGGEYKLEIVNSNGVGKALCLVKDNLAVTASVKGTKNVTDGAAHTLTCNKTSTGVTLVVDGQSWTKTVSAGLGAVSNSAKLTIGVKTATVTGVGGDFYNGVMSGASVSVG
jgi:concanavalin A-like lectin/glucanase superfamily protein